MKKIFLLFTFVMLVLTLFAWQISPGYAQTLTVTPTLQKAQATSTAVKALLPMTPTPSSAAAVVGDKNTFSLNDLGIREQVMTGPYYSTSIPFSVPADWELIPGGEITLNFTYSQNLLANNSLPNNANQIHGILVVMLNNQVLENITLDKIGDYSVVVPITNPKALSGQGKDGRNLVRLLLDASASCYYGIVNSTLLVRNTSSLRLDHQSITPSIDLSLFPRPLYQANQVLHTQTLIVIPDQPSLKELQSAMVVATGLGKQTQGNLDLSVKTYKELSDADKKSKFLIFIGKATHYPNLVGINLPLPISKDGMNLPDAQKNDGVIQMTVSPWDSTKTVLVLSANTDDGVLKAGQAVSTGKIITGGRPDLSLVDSINPDGKGLPIVQDQSLANLGYSTQTLGTVGDNYADIFFNISPEQALSTDATINLVLSHSNLLNDIGTTYSVFLNDQVISSDHFTAKSEQIVSSQIKVLPHLLRPGENHLEIFSNLLPLITCNSTDFSASWLTISDSSSIHVPLPADNNTAIKFNQTLKDYPSFLIDNPTLGDLALVVAKNDPVSWKAAANVAFYLGAKGNPNFTDLSTFYGDDVPQNIRQEHNFLFVGRASTLPVLSEINSNLPAPFDKNSDQTNQSVMLVNYSLPAGVNVGYIQFMVSPWNADKVVMSLSGNTGDGIPMAARALSTDSLVSLLAGNYALINGDQILTTNTRLGISKEAVTEKVAGAVTVTPVMQLPQSTLVASIPVSASSVPEIKGHGYCPF